MVSGHRFNLTHYTAAVWRRAAALGCIVFALISCSPEKKLQRLVKKHPELLKKDTIYIHDTILTKEIKTDTFFVSKKTTDTFYLDKEKLKIQIIRQRETIRVSAQVKQDTIFIEKKIPVEKIHVKYDYINPLLNKIMLLSLLLLIILILLLYDKRKN